MALRDSKENWAAYQREWRRSHPETYRRYYPSLKERKRGDPRVLAYYAKYRAKHRDKIRARKLFNNAIKRGDIQRQPCEVCAQLNAEGHHPDYTKALEVRWFCKAHHEEHHHPHPVAD